MASDTIEMRAAVCRGFDKPLAIETLRLAPPEGSEIRVRVRASSICHSDIIFMDGGWGGEDAAVRALVLTDGRGFDVVMTAVGEARIIEQALPLLARDGALVAVGMPPDDERVSLDATGLSHFGQRLIGCKMGGARLRVDVPKLFRLYRSGRLKLDELVASQRPLAEINQSIARARRSRDLRHVIVFPG